MEYGALTLSSTVFYIICNVSGRQYTTGNEVLLVVLDF
jgi:hypothetical protein